MKINKYGVSTGETGDYGVGDIFVGEVFDKDEMTLDGEPVYNVFESDDVKFL